MTARPTRQAKLHRPAVAQDLVRRPRLLERLRTGFSHPLTLVCAPAGYGKTTLVGHWLETGDRPAAWLALDEEDADPIAFLRCIADSIESLFPDSCRQTLAALASSLPPETAALTGTLADDLDALEKRFVLVLEDYDAIRSPGVHEVVDGILRRPPRSLHLVLLTRRDPPLALHAKRARGQVNEIRQQELRFTEEEIACFVRQAVGIDLEDIAVERLEERSEGWAAGLRLLTLAIRESGGEVAGILERLPEGIHLVQEYLAVEVLSRQPAEIQEGLLRTSILDRFTAPLCDAVLAPVQDRLEPALEGTRFLEHLRSQNLFAIPLDASHEWWRFQSSFREFLRRALAQRASADEIADLHDRARDWLDEMGLVEEAVDHALRGSRPESAVAVIWSHRTELMDAERWSELWRWLQRLPPEVAEDTVEALMLRAWIVPPPALPTILDRIEAMLPEATVPGMSAEALRCELEVLKGHQYYDVADGRGAAECAERALAGLPFEPRIVRANAWFVLALGRQMEGERESAERALEEGHRELADRGGAPYATILHARCFLHWAEADLDATRDAAALCLDLSHREGLPHSRPIAEELLALVCYQRNKLEAARDVLEGSPGSAEFVDHEIAMVLLLLAEDRFEEATEAVEKILARCLERGAQPVLDRLRALQAEMARRRGRASEAEAWARGFEPGPPRPLGHGFEPRLVRVRILLAEGTESGRSRAEAHLAEIRETAEATHNRRILIEVLALEALLRDRQGRVDEAREALEGALERARSAGMVRVFLDLGPDMESLLERRVASRDHLAFAARIRHAFRSAGIVEGSVRNKAPAAAVEVSPQELASPLTNREIDVLELLAKRYSNKEIASRLYISPQTVKRHSINLYQKLHVHRRRDAVTKAVELGLLPGS